MRRKSQQYIDVCKHAFDFNHNRHSEDFLHALALFSHFIYLLVPKGRKIKERTLIINSIKIIVTSKGFFPLECVKKHLELYMLAVDLDLEL